MVYCLLRSMALSKKNLHAQIFWNVQMTGQNKQNKHSTSTVAYINLSRAFDTVSHKKLLARLYSYGIRGVVLLWIQNFFCKPHSPD